MDDVNGFQNDRPNLPKMQIEVEAVQKIPMEMARRYRMIGVRIRGNTLTVLTSSPLHAYEIEDVRQTAGMELELLTCGEQELEHAIRYYYAEARARKAVSAANAICRKGDGRFPAEYGEEDGTLVISLLDSLIHHAYHSNASDIHIEPFEKQTLVRMRIDGAVIPFVSLERRLHAPLVARIKILGDMDIAERRIPQDGHFRMEMEGVVVNMRISVVPAVFGEKAVIRLLDGNTAIDYSETFGMTPDGYARLSRLLRSPNGLIYMTGPTGSGKTTTLYMVLKELAKRQMNILTVEDPVEKNLEGITQCQVNNAAGMTFESGLRALLRQDPDIIMVGETRDRETASISVRAAITGHLVLSTLHTNDAVSAIVRLEDMGIEPYLVANSLTGVVAQRLMRKLCPDCAREIEADEDSRRFLGKKDAVVKVAVGCPKCRYTGYLGRIAIHEILGIDRTLREMITSGAGMEQIKEYALKGQGMETLKEQGIRLVEQGITSLEELFKVAYDG